MVGPLLENDAKFFQSIFPDVREVVEMWKEKKNTSPADVAKSLSIFSDAREVVEMSKKTQVPPM